MMILNGSSSIALFAFFFLCDLFLVQSTPILDGYSHSPHKAQVASRTFETRSGGDRALTFSEWLIYLPKLDKVLQDDQTFTGPQMTVFVWGGLSGVSLGSRGDDGATADGDVTIPSTYNGGKRDSFLKAAETVQGQNSDKLGNDWINTGAENYISAEAQQDSLEHPGHIIYDGQKVRFVNGDYCIQLVSKMDRMAYYVVTGLKSAVPETWEKDLQDSVQFLYNCVMVRNGQMRVALSQMDQWVRLVQTPYTRHYTATQLAQKVSGFIAEYYDGFEEDVKSLWEG